MNHNYRLWIAGVLFLLTLGLLLGFSQALLVPHDPAQNREAALVRDFIHGFDGQDVLFLGDCEVYESFSTATLWNEYGINAYVCGSPQQLLWHSYAMLQQAFAVESPSCVVLSVYGLRYATPQSEAYNRIALDGLPFSPHKLAAARVGMTEGESLTSYVFPLLRYHDRWDEVTWRDVRLLFERYEPVSYQGYLMQTGIVPDADGVIDHEGALPLTAPEFGSMAVAYLEKIAALCKERGARLILIKAPTDSWAYPWYEEWEVQTEALAQRLSLPYYNLLEAYDAIGLDSATDTYDGGVHLNVHGAEKTAAYLGALLQKEYHIPDRRADAQLSERWRGLSEQYENEKNGVR